MSLKDNTKRKNIKTKTKNLPKTKGGKAIASGGFGCVFKPALECNKKGTRNNKKGEITKLMKIKYAKELGISPDDITITLINKFFSDIIYESYNDIIEHLPDTTQVIVTLKQTQPSPGSPTPIVNSNDVGKVLQSTTISASVDNDSITNVTGNNVTRLLDPFFQYALPFLFISAILYSIFSAFNIDLKDVFLTKIACVSINIFIILCGYLATCIWFKITPILLYPDFTTIKNEYQLK